MLSHLARPLFREMPETLPSFWGKWYTVKRKSNFWWIEIVTPDQCRMGRAAARIGIREVAQWAKISTNTVIRFERGEKLKDSTIRLIQAILETTGVTFIEDDGKGPGVRFKPRPVAGKSGKPRR